MNNDPITTLDELAALEARLTEGEPYISQTEREYIAIAQRVIAAHRRVLTALEAVFPIGHGATCGLLTEARQCTCDAGHANTLLAPIMYGESDLAPDR